MGDAEARRTALVERLADVILAEGLEALALRPAAARLGTSDRMLLYYFGTKGQMVDAVLACASMRLETRLAALGDDTRTPDALVRGTVAMLADAEARQFLRLWFEVVARAGRGDAAFVGAARRIVESWLTWIDARIALPPGADRRRAALAILAFLDGASALDAIVPGAATGLAEVFSLTPQ